MVGDEHGPDARQAAVDEDADGGRRTAHDLVHGATENGRAEHGLVPAQQHEIGRLHRRHVADVGRRLRRYEGQRADLETERPGALEERRECDRVAIGTTLREHERRAVVRELEAERVEAAGLGRRADERAGQRHHPGTRAVVGDAHEDRERVRRTDVRPGDLLLSRVVHPLDERGRRECGEESHQHHHREQRGGDHPEVEADVEHDQLHQAACVHQHAERGGLPPPEPGETRGDRAAAELPEARDADHEAAHPPGVERVEEPNLGPQPAVGEEQRQQEDDHQVLELVREDLGEAVGLRDDRPDHKRTEERVDADDLGGQAGEEQQHQRHGDEVLAEALLVRAASGQASEERPDERQHDADVDERECRRPRGVAEASGAHDRHDEGEDAPRGHVVHGRARDRDRAELRVQEATLDQDAGQDGKRRDAHGRAHEQGERAERHGRRRQTGIEVPREDGAEREGNDDARVADHDRRVAAAA